MWGFLAVAKIKIIRPLSSKSFPSLSPSLFSAVQVFQKCTVKDVGVENLVEPTTRIETQIRELRSGALLPLKEKKVKYASLCSNPANCLPLPTLWYTWWLCLNTSTTFAPFALAQEKPVTAASKKHLSLPPQFSSLLWFCWISQLEFFRIKSA